MEFNSISAGGQVALTANNTNSAHPSGDRAVTGESHDQKAAVQHGANGTHPEILKTVQAQASFYNTHLSFTINDKLGQVVVKVLDSTTEKVIREIPTEEMQRLSENFRQSVGLLVDEEA